jgi:small subunit ribosomal protein S6
MVSNKVEEKARVELLEGVKKDFDKLTKEDLWGSRDLAYPIQHMDSAYYAHFEFESDPSKISSLDKKLKLDEDVIRYLLVRKS